MAQWFRLISSFVMAGSWLVFSNNLFAATQLDQMMSADEQQKTGLFQLSAVQKRELGAWIDRNFVLKLTPSKKPTLSLQANFFNGAQLLLSDHSLYEIAPRDRLQASSWLSVIVTVETTDDPDYPWNITNTVTHVTVQAKMIRGANP